MPGLAAALSEPVTQAQPRRLFDLGSNGLFLGILVVEIVALVLLPANRSGAYANLGAVEMARLELAGWSDKAQNKTALFESPAQPVPDLFLKALEIDPTNASALYRLGMIAMENGDFTQARDYLEAANLSSPAHRGIRKLLGYSYTWLDQTEAAVTALRPIPEAAQELGYYAWWWGTQNKPDLSEYARKVHERLRMP
jgi:tetratricopeptide (TPR) repeat protein